MPNPQIQSLTVNGTTYNIVDNTSGYITGMTILSYGSSTWQDFINAYSGNKVVYCRASSQANPATGDQTRLAFMAYVNNSSNPTSVEFQYYRSVSTHTESQQGDQVFVYTLTSAGSWSVTTREASVKVAVGGDLTGSYSNGTYTVSGDIPTVPVTDVTVGGTSVVSSGTAIIPEEIFIAEYGVTTFQELVDAYEAGKTLFCKDTSVPDTKYILPLAFYDTQSAGYEYMQFSGFQDSSSSLNLIINADDNWSTESSSYSSATNWKNGGGSYSVRMEASSATGSNSVAQNRGTTAQRKSQTALGEFNIADTSGTTTTRGDYAVIVGNGTSNSNRSNALTIDWDGNVVASGNATTSDMSNTDIANFLASLNIRGACPYMVGDIYITTNSVSPETIWVGTEWDRIEDTFLLSAGSTYTAGDTGGSADAIVPYHTHTFTDHWVTYKLNTTSRKPGTSTAVNYGTSITATNATGSYTTNAPSDTTSGNTVGANMPPYLVVNVWVRTA